MTRNQWIILGLIGGAAVWAYFNQDSIESGAIDVEATVAGWKNVQQGPVWVPVLNQTEDALGIPKDLLARIAYQESHFRQDIIDGSKISSAGALGLMQLEPGFFHSVNVARPYTSADTVAQITEAAHLLVNLFNHFQDWGLAIAAYNDGQGNVDQYVAGKRTLPAETTNYVTAVLADVPVASQAFYA